MGKIPSYVIVIIGLALAVGLSAYFYFKPVKARKAEITALEQQYAQLEAKAQQVPQLQHDLDVAKADSAKVETAMGQWIAKRSIPISFIYPYEAFMSLWPEYQTNLPTLIRQFVARSGCQLVSAGSLPPPPTSPIAAPTGAGGYAFMQVPGAGQPIALTLQGKLGDIERFYHSLRNFPRVVTLNQLSLNRAGGDQLTATVGLSIYLLVEVPQAAPPAPPVAPMGGAPD